jgi:hypothetical protein
MAGQFLDRSTLNGEFLQTDILKLTPVFMGRMSNYEHSTHEDKNIMLSQNVRHQSPSNTAPHPKTMMTSTPPLEKSKNSH